MPDDFGSVSLWLLSEGNRGRITKHTARGAPPRLFVSEKELTLLIVGGYLESVIRFQRGIRCNGIGL